MRRIAVMVFLLFSFAAGFIMLGRYPHMLFEVEFTGTPISVWVTERGHFHSNDFTVELRSRPEAAEIFYTLDGSTPSLISQKYEGPISIQAGANTEATVLRAVAISQNESSAILTHTFFHGADIEDRFNTLVFSLSTDDRNLHDPQIGIFTEANVDQRGREYERPINVEIFQADGMRHLNQAAGVRVTGVARDEPVKAIRIISRREYSPLTGGFAFHFFPGDMSLDGRDRIINSYDNFILRNGGLDRNYGMLRHEVCSVLARQAGFKDVTPVRAAAMFINGEYYGHMWVNVRVDEHYLQALYSTPMRTFDLVGRGEWYFDEALPEQEEALIYKNNFADRDLTDDAEFESLLEILDVENMLRFYAFQIWVGNNDWPSENMYRWRYIGNNFVDMAEELDGRWRYAMFGLDRTLGHANDDFNNPTLHRLLDSTNQDGALFRAILQRDDMKALFITIMNELMETALNYDVISEILTELRGEIIREADFAIDAGLLRDNVNSATVQSQHERILDFAHNRHNYINSSMAELLGAGSAQITETETEETND